MKQKIKNTDYISPSAEAIELVLEGSILVDSPGGEGGEGGGAGGDAGGLEWD